MMKELLIENSLCLLRRMTYVDVGRTIELKKDINKFINIFEKYIGKDIIIIDSKIKGENFASDFDFKSLTDLSNYILNKINYGETIYLYSYLYNNQIYASKRHRITFYSVYEIQKNRDNAINSIIN